MPLAWSKSFYDTQMDPSLVTTETELNQDVLCMQNLKYSVYLFIYWLSPCIAEASHQKLLMQAEEAVRTQLDDAQRRIVAVQKASLLLFKEIWLPAFLPSDSGYIFHDNCIACSTAFACGDMAVLSRLLVWHLILRRWQEFTYMGAPAHPKAYELVFIMHH